MLHTNFIFTIHSRLHTNIHDAKSFEFEYLEFFILKASSGQLFLRVGVKYGDLAEFCREYFEIISQNLSSRTSRTSSTWKLIILYLTTIVWENFENLKIQNRLGYTYVASYFYFFWFFRWFYIINTLPNSPHFTMHLPTIYPQFAHDINVLF